MKRYLIAGLLVWVPLGITLWVLHFLLTSLDQVLIVLPESAQPRNVLGFDIPGLGQLLVDSIFTRDFPILQGLTLVFGLLVIAINLLSDVAYCAIDPRVRLG